MMKKVLAVLVFAAIAATSYGQRVKIGPQLERCHDALGNVQANCWVVTQANGEQEYITLDAAKTLLGVVDSSLDTAFVRNDSIIFELTDAAGVVVKTWGVAFPTATSDIHVVSADGDTITHTAVDGTVSEYIDVDELQLVSGATGDTIQLLENGVVQSEVELPVAVEKTRNRECFDVTVATNSLTLAGVPGGATLLGAEFANVAWNGVDLWTTGDYGWSLNTGTGVVTLNSTISPHPDETCKICVTYWYEQ